MKMLTKLQEEAVAVGAEERCKGSGNLKEIYRSSDHHCHLYI